MILKFFVGFLFLTYVVSVLTPSMSLRIRDANKSVVKVRRIGGGGGSGFIVSTKKFPNLVITNAHVCRKDKSFSLLKGSLEVGSAEVIDSNINLDLCALKPDKDVFDPLTTASNSYVYEEVYTLGYPYLDLLSYSSGYALVPHKQKIAHDDLTVDECIAKGGESQIYFGEFGPAVMCLIEFDVVFTSLKAYPGTSGSPVFNARGYVVGVIMAMQSSTYNAEVIRLDTLKKFLEDK